MKKILMLGTGGTIASRQTKDGLAPGLTPEDILSYIPAVKNVCEVQTRQVCNLDSTNVTPEHWKMMVKAVEDNYAYYDGFVICHGTDTLAYTAAALSYMIQNSANCCYRSAEANQYGCDRCEDKSAGQLYLCGG